MDSELVNIYTSCDNNYAYFVPLFALSHIVHNPDAVVEVNVIGEVGEIDSLDYRAIAVVRDMFPMFFRVTYINKVYIEIDDKQYQVKPNVHRFLSTPGWRTSYVYISDVDIICLQKFKEIHIAHMKDNNLPYSNMVRQKTSSGYKRLTGLHFSPWDNYYPIVNIDEFVKAGLLNHDEVMLYQIVNAKLGTPEEQSQFRPVHGIHASPNRVPEADELGWGLKHWKEQWQQFITTEAFLEASPYFTKELTKVVRIINKYYKNTQS